MFDTFFTGRFDFDICRFVCLVRIWKRQANSCGINLPNIPDTIDTSLSKVEQWNMAVSWWTTLRDVWSAQAVNRGFKVTSPTLQNLGNYFCHWLTVMQTFSNLSTSYQFCIHQSPVNPGLTSGRQA